jgi:hypothetical protein
LRLRFYASRATGGNHVEQPVRPRPGGSCPDIQVGDELEADGYQNGVGDPNSYFVAADSVEVTPERPARPIV